MVLKFSVLWCLLAMFTFLGLATACSLPIPQDPLGGVDRQLRTLSAETYTMLKHPQFPKLSIRIKRSQLCENDTSNAYTGYIDVGAHHLFFYFIESRRNPAQDDVLLWNSGGPGCSGSMGLFLELGPCKIEDKSGPIYNPYSWTEFANIFFIDQPVGTGYSYADDGSTLVGGTTEEAAADVADFISVFFFHFPQFQGLPFHIAGESYGGRYVPLFAAAILNQNTALLAMGHSSINLRSIIIANGATDTLSYTLGFYDILCTKAYGVAPVMDISTCVHMRQARPRCEAMIRQSCLQSFDEMACRSAMLFCSANLELPFLSTGLNPYDISKECQGPISETLCYPVTRHLFAYLSANSTRQMLDYHICNSEVHAHFDSTLDRVHPPQTSLYVASLLERGVSALVYNGDRDWACNAPGTAHWTYELDWSGGEEFRSAPIKSWEINGKRKGTVRTARGLQVVTVAGAGHMVPMDQPREMLYLIEHWFSSADI